MINQTSYRQAQLSIPHFRIPATGTHADGQRYQSFNSSFQDTGSEITQNNVSVSFFQFLILGYKSADTGKGFTHRCQFLSIPHFRILGWGKLWKQKTKLSIPHFRIRAPSMRGDEVPDSFNSSFQDTNYPQARTTHDNQTFNSSFQDTYHKHQKR